jgi:hypothetical protein
MCSSLKLRFDGKDLIMTGGKKTYSYPAASGKPAKDGSFNYSKIAQMGGPGGPIPEGTYWINPDELWTNRWYKSGSVDAWGNYRITIHPFLTTDTFKRGGFFIHGGKILGSAGCIDLTKYMDTFVKDLSSELATRACQIHLKVDYSGGSK